MDIEGRADFADGFSFFNESSGEGALVRAQFGRAAEGDATCLSGAPSFLGSVGDQRAFELRDASEHGEHHAPGQRRRIKEVQNSVGSNGEIIFRLRRERTFDIDVWTFNRRCRLL